MACMIIERPTWTSKVPKIMDLIPKQCSHGPLLWALPKSRQTIRGMFEVSDIAAVSAPTSEPCSTLFKAVRQQWPTLQIPEGKGPY